MGSVASDESPLNFILDLMVFKCLCGCNILELQWCGKEIE